MQTPESKRLSKSKPRRATGRAGSTYRAGRATREAIVRAAEAVLRDHGLAEFTVQRVAKSLGMSPGNLNYYFPTRASLLDGLILDTLEQYRQRTQVLADALPTAGKAAAIDAVLRWLMRDAATGRTSSLFRQLWAIAAINPQAAASMDDFYNRSVHGHLERLGLVRGRALAVDHEALMVLVHVLSEGTTVLFGTRRRSGALFRRVETLAARAIALLAEGPPQPVAAARARAGAARPLARKPRRAPGSDS